MDDLSLTQLLQILRVTGYAITATYFISLSMRRERDRWLYLSLFFQFAFVVVWGGIGIYRAEFEQYARPWQTIPVIVTVAVIAHDFCAARSRKQRTLRSISREVSASAHIST